MIKVTNEEISGSGPWVGEFGQYERVLSGEITQEVCDILDSSSPKMEIMSCVIDNIDIVFVPIGFHKVKRSNGDIETWYYAGQGRINKEVSLFSRPDFD